MFYYYVFKINMVEVFYRICFIRYDDEIKSLVKLAKDKIEFGITDRNTQFLSCNALHDPTRDSSRDEIMQKITENKYDEIFINKDHIESIEPMGIFTSNKPNRINRTNRNIYKQ